MSEYNLIKGNTIKHSKIGILIPEKYSANDIYQNNFIQNSISALNYNYFFGNHWTGFSLSEKRWIGNYWDDYTGIDADGDGNGDTPYVAIADLPHVGLVLDLYPHMTPFPFRTQGPIILAKAELIP